MAIISKIYRESLPAMRLIGKRYTNMDRGPLGGFGLKWEEWMSKEYNVPLESMGAPLLFDGSFIGAMRFTSDFEYWTGMFFPEGTTVPDGYLYVDLPAGDIAACWVHGKARSGELYGEHVHKTCISKIHEKGWEPSYSPWFFERYVIPRFITPDENGRVILDYCIFIRNEYD